MFLQVLLCLIAFVASPSTRPQAASSQSCSQRTLTPRMSQSRERKRAETGFTRFPRFVNFFQDCILIIRIFAYFHVMFLCHKFHSDISIPNSHSLVLSSLTSLASSLSHSYVEAAILKCYSFLTNQEFTQALIRLTRMIRGIGDPLVACYARAYLCRVGLFVAPNARTHLMPNFTDYLSTVQQVGDTYKYTVSCICIYIVHTCLMYYTRIS